MKAGGRELWAVLARKGKLTGQCGILRWPHADLTSTARNALRVLQNLGHEVVSHSPFNRGFGKVHIESERVANAKSPPTLMPYVATFFVFGRREPAERQFETLVGALRFLTRGMADGSLYVGELLHHNGDRIASHEWLLDHWSDLLSVLIQGKPPSTHPAVHELPDE